MGTSSAWTPERRTKQAEAIRHRKPWEKSTGPKTAEGKAVASRNADKGGQRPRHRIQMRLLREMMRASRAWVAIICEAFVDGNIKGECIDPEYDRSERFQEAQARHERASAEYWRFTLRTDDPDWRLPFEEAVE